MLVAVAVDADRRHQDMVAHMQTVDLDDQQVEPREVRGEPGLHLLARQRHEAPGNGRLGSPVATLPRQIALGQTDSAAVFAGRDVQHHQIERPLQQQVAVAKNLPALQAHLLAGAVTNPWPAYLHPAAMVADLAGRRAPTVAPAIRMAAMPGATHRRGVLFHHLGQGLNPGQQTEPVNAEGNFLHGVAQRR